MSSDWHQVWISLLFFNYLLLVFFLSSLTNSISAVFYPFFKATAPPLLDPVSLSGRDHSNLSALTWLTQVAGCLLSFCLSHTLKIQDLNPLLCCCLAEFLVFFFFFCLSLFPHSPSVAVFTHKSMKWNWNNVLIHFFSSCFYFCSPTRILIILIKRRKEMTWLRFALLTLWLLLLCFFFYLQFWESKKAKNRWKKQKVHTIFGVINIRGERLSAFLQT